MACLLCAHTGGMNLEKGMVRLGKLHANRREEFFED